MKGIILASQSPRRKELLNQIGLKFEVIPSQTDEKFDKDKSIVENIENIALKKALDVAKNIKKDALIVGADTIVVMDEVLGKPSSPEEAKKILHMLSGKTHQVITGISVVDVLTKKFHTSHQITYVTMNSFSLGDIDSYIASKEYMDKAGSYAIQGLGALLVKEIQGDYFNVVGLPINLLSQLLKRFNYNIFSEFY